jgi:hypothetical protein
MKRFIVPFVMLVCVAGVFAGNPIFNVNKMPPISLPDACAMATHILGTETNRFYCVGARLDASRPSNDGDWWFSFCSTNGEVRNVYIFLDKKTKPEVLDELPPT